MSFATALLYALGGRNRGRQQTYENQQQQQQLTLEQQREARESAIQTAQEKALQDQTLRARGLDPSTGTWNQSTYQFDNARPFAPLPDEQRVVPGKVGTHYQVTPQDLVAHYTRLAQQYAEEGRTDRANIMQNQAATIQQEILRAQTENATFNRELALFGLRDKATDARQQKTLDSETERQLRSEGFEMNAMGDRQDYSTWQSRVRDAQTGVRTAAGAVTKAGSTIESEMAKLESSNVDAGKGKTHKDAQGNTVPDVVVNPAMGAYRQLVGGIVAKIKGGAGVDYANKKIDEISKNPNFSDAQRDTAIGIISEYRDAVQQAQQAHQELEDTYHDQPHFQSGGSPGTGNPTKGAKVAPRSIWQMLIDNGATPDEATTLTAVAMAESGGDPGSVNPTDNGGKQTSWGLFQISDGTHNEPAGWDDPLTNVQMAIAKLRSQGLKAWGTYDSGAYKKYLPKTELATR
jgi:hypothetical protein